MQYFRELLKKNAKMFSFSRLLLTHTQTEKECLRVKRSMLNGRCGLKLAGADSQVQQIMPNMCHFIYQIKRVCIMSMYLYQCYSCSPTSVFLYPFATKNISVAHSYASGGSLVTIKRQMCFRLCFRALIARISTHAQSFSPYYFS